MLTYIISFVPQVTQQVPLVEQELLTAVSPVLYEVHHGFSVFRVAQYLVFCVMVCRSLLVLLYFSCWPLCCLYCRFHSSVYRFDIFRLFFFSKVKLKDPKVSKNYFVPSRRITPS
jgi:hypothetical protein